MFDRKAGFLLLVLMCTPAWAQTMTEQDTTVLEALRVTGMQEEELNQNIAPKRVGKEVLEAGRITDVSRALKNVPGVYVRDEEGQGLRPNIGLRGTNPDRSKKVVILEDEILSGPAPYSAPAAYYTPSLNLSEELEIYRGFAAMAYGPNSIGGAVNYLSYPVPDKATQWVDLSYGSYGSSNLKAFLGNATSWGGYVFQLGRIASEGFKALDGGGDTGFHRTDAKGKLKFKLPEVDGRIQDVQLRIGFGEENSHETYLGLFDSDFAKSPYRRYSSSALDDMKWVRNQVELEYTRQLSDTGVLKATAYWHQFARTWYRFYRFRDKDRLKNVLDSPDTPVNAVFRDILRGVRDSSDVGAIDGQLVMASNDRSFLSQGLQASWNEDFQAGSVKHRLRLLGRLHQDQIDRDHTYDYFEMLAGKMERTADARQIDKINREWSLATSLSLQDDIEMGPWVLSLVGRAEKADFLFRDKVAVTENKRSDSYLAPGVGLLRRLNANWSSRVSVNKAVTIAGLDPSGRDEREESLNYEWGIKYLADDRQREADVVFFLNDYQNITGTCTASNGCSSTNLDAQLNGGAAKVYGLEARVAQGFWARGFYLPVQLNVTALKGEFANSFSTTDGEWGSGTVQSGDPLPYIPNLQYSISLGLEKGRFKQNLNIVYQSSMESQSVEEGRKSIPAYAIVDWNANYKWSESIELFGKADNLLAKDYLVAYRPLGARPGKPQSFMLGFKSSF